jgi:hypothetical protein
MQQVIAQTETFDIATYNPPKGWKRSTGQGYVIFQDGKQTGSTGSFCILIVYASRQSSGDADKDFKMEWTDLVEKPNSITVTPETQKEQTPEGWTVVNGATKLKEGLHEYTCMLVSVTGFGKVMSVLVKVAGQDYLADIENFLTNMQLDGAAAANNNTNNSPQNVSLSANTETFDIATYKPPKDWKKDTRQGVVSYTITNPSTGGFCVIGIYAAKASEGTAEKDFAGEWNDLAVTPFAAEKNPKSEIQTTADGWKAVAAKAPVTFNNAAAYIVLATLNDQAYIALVDSFLENITLDKNAIIAKSTPANSNIEQPNTNSGTSIIGVWSNSDKPIIKDVISQSEFVGSNDTQGFEEYEFKADNTYVSRYFNRSNSGNLYYTETTGTFKIDGRNLTLTPVKRRGGYIGGRGQSFAIKNENDLRGVIKDESHLLGKPVIFDCFIGPTPWKDGPFLNLHKEGNYYINANFPYDYYNRLK